MKKEIEIITLIYKSIDYLSFIYDQLKSDYNKIDGWKVGIRIVANDATDEILVALGEFPDVNISIYSDKKLDDYYLNRVYRCWNRAVKTSAYENVCLVNSDMAFSPGWLANLVNGFDLEKIVPCSRLVESGKLLSGQYALVKNFGRHPNEFKEERWLDYVGCTQSDALMSGGLYMPCVFNRDKFIEAGGYPEGNIYKDGAGTMNGDVLKSGDAYFFDDVLRKKFKINHLTVFNSLVYHIQEGEMDE